MISKSPALPSRLFTTHGTVLFVDPLSGELRHGPLEASPANARALLDGPRTRIVHDAAGSLRPIVCDADRSGTTDSKSSAEGAVTPTVFELVTLYQRWIGLRSHGCFLCAEPDGRVTLSRKVCSSWESFLPSEAYSLHFKAPSLSISCVETRNIAQAVAAVARTAECIRADCLYWFSSSAYPSTLPGTEIINIIIPDFTDFFDDINRICLRQLPRIVATDFNLTVQPDGFAVNPQAWDERFWEFDYIGAPWPWMWGGGPYWPGPIVGNGGFSFRSRKLYRALLALDIQWQIADWAADDRINCREFYTPGPNGEKFLPEDILISLWYRDRLENEFGIKFCPPELANKFSVETVNSFSQYWLGRSFGFHGFAAAPYYGVELRGSNVTAPPANPSDDREQQQTKIFCGDDLRSQVAANTPGPDYEPDVAAEAAVSDPPVRVIALYLPQFHPIPENDRAWGKGFTEWTNVSKALPRFAGHLQPRLPGELGFYDLRLVEVLQRQAELARRYGLGGFCFHYYWFDGRSLLATPLNLLLANRDIDIPFCINWANEDWTRRWDGASGDVIVAQRHSPEDDFAFARSLEPLMRDDRYIRIGGRPLLLLYRPKLLPDAASTVRRWRRHFSTTGLGDPYIVMFHAFDYDDPRIFGMDAAAGFPPHRVGWDLPDINQSIANCDPGFKGHIKSYEAMAERAFALSREDFTFFHGVCPGWDNTPRQSSAQAVCFAGSSPKSYGSWLARACRRALDERVGEERIVFINAWNEWGEGAYLEPDRHYGYGYLAETARVLNTLK